ncbi:MAG: DUF1800 domain-containing protein [Bacteroidota bacterium]
MSDRIKHLYQRAGFGASPEEWEQLKRQGFLGALEQLFTQAHAAPPLTVASFEDLAEATMEDRRKAGRMLTQSYTLEWLDRMADPTESALLERLTLFWHDHFACRSILGHLAIQQLNTLREYALGSFRDLCLAVAKDPSMIRYLNNQQNKKNSPNENFARELLELFTIGRGNYTEQDIKEAARAFTGWGSNYKGIYRFRARAHDYGQKTFFGQSGRFNGEDIIRIILDQRESAEFLVRKFWDYYVSAPADEGLIQELTSVYYESDYHTETLLRYLFAADWFYDQRFRGGQIKSPIVLLIGLRKTLGLQFGKPAAQARLLRALGQTPFDPPNVAGWPGGRHWIDNATLMLRLNIGAGLLSKRELDLRFRDQPELEILSDPSTRKLEAVVNLQSLLPMMTGTDLVADFGTLSDYLLPGPSRIDMTSLVGLVDNTEGEERLRRMLLVLFSLPEFQTC